MKNKKKCGTCIYRSAKEDIYGCDFILITGHMRGCSASECNKYKRGRKIKAAKNPRWSGNGLRDA